jgi:uncharacterized protein (UPF0335 family)
MTETGHNSTAQLKSIVERIERLDEEIKGIRSDQKDIFAEAKGVGYDVKALRRVIAIRKMEAGKHEEFENIVDTYLNALGAAS